MQRYGNANRTSALPKDQRRTSRGRARLWHTVVMPLVKRRNQLALLFILDSDQKTTNSVVSLSLRLKAHLGIAGKRFVVGFKFLGAVAINAGNPASSAMSSEILRINPTRCQKDHPNAWTVFASGYASRIVSYRGQFRRFH
jgi:hypothetical protein